METLSPVTAEASAEELRYLARLAQAGRDAPPLGGVLMAAFGLCMGIGTLVSWASAFRVGPPVNGLIDLGLAFLIFATLAAGPGPLNPRRLAVTAIVSLAIGVALGEAATLLLVRALGAPGSRDPVQFRLHANLIMACMLGLVFAGLAMTGLLILRLRRHAASLAAGNPVAGAAFAGAIGGFILITTIFALVGVRGNWFMMMSLPGVFWAIWGMAWAIIALAGERRWGLMVALGSAGVALWYGATLDAFATSVVGMLALAFLPGLVMILKAARAGAR